uniref:Lipid-binding serum glycoprotein N-terminal domain-containing protein n=1 Tax=Strigamia maritima TaxID=126957 RepID=T1J1N0_STRMM
MKSNSFFLFFILISTHAVLSRRNDLNFDCDRIQKIFRHLTKGENGIPELAIPDPIQIPDFTVQKTSPKVNANFQNTSLYGISNFIISRVHLDLVKPKLDIALELPQLNARGEYSLKASSYFFSVNGAGPFWMNITRIHVSCLAELTSDEAGRFLISAVHVNLDIGDLKLHFENLGTWEKLSNNIINALSSSLIHKIKPTVISQAREKILTKGNEFLANLPPQDLLFSPLFPIDVVLAEVCAQIETLGLDPKQIENQTWKFEKTIFFVRFHGKVTLFDGYIKGLSTLHRSGDVEASFIDGCLQFRVRLGFDELEAGYKMAVEFQGLEKVNGVHLVIDSVDLELVVELCDDVLPPCVKEFKFVDIRQVSVDVDGLGSLDAILEFSTNSFVNVFKYQLSEVVENDIKTVIQERMANITFNNTCRSIV